MWSHWPLDLYFFKIAVFFEDLVCAKHLIYIYIYISMTASNSHNNLANMVLNPEKKIISEIRPPESHK